MTLKDAPLAEVRCSCGRYCLFVAGLVLAVESDPCRDGSFPDALYEPIPPEELAQATIGDKKAADLPPDVVRFFRGCRWNEALLRHAAAEINKAAS